MTNSGLLILLPCLWSTSIFADTISTPGAVGNVQYNVNDSLNGLVGPVKLKNSGILAPVSPGGTSPNSILNTGTGLQYVIDIPDTASETAIASNAAQGALSVTGPTVNSLAQLSGYGADGLAKSETTLKYFMTVQPIVAPPFGVIPSVAYLRVTGKLSTTLNTTGDASGEATATITADGGLIAETEFIESLSISDNGAPTQAVDVSGIGLFPDKVTQITLDTMATVSSSYIGGGLAGYTGGGNADAGIDPVFELEPESQPYFTLVFGSTAEEVESPEPGYCVLLGLSLVCGVLYSRRLRSRVVGP